MIAFLTALQRREKSESFQPHSCFCHCLFLSAPLYLPEHRLSSEGFVLSTVLIPRALLIRNAIVWMLIPPQITFLKKVSLKMYVCVSIT